MQRIAKEFQENTTSALQMPGQDSPFSCVLSGIAFYQHLRQVESDHPVVARHRDKLIDAFKNANAEPLLMMFNVKSHLLASVESLFEHTNLVLDYEPDSYSFLAPRDLEWSFYTTYYHQIVCRARDILIDVACLEDNGDSEVDYGKRLELEQLALNVVNGIYNFLTDVSDADTCPINLRTILRLHLINFGQPEPFDGEDSDIECDTDRQFADNFDIASRDLRLSAEDLKSIGEKSQFLNDDWQRFKTSRYCYDIA